LTVIAEEVGLRQLEDFARGELLGDVLAAVRIGALVISNPGIAGGWSRRRPRWAAFFSLSPTVRSPILRALAVLIQLLSLALYASTVAMRTPFESGRVGMVTS
jgi:hypothetical protein